MKSAEHPVSMDPWNARNGKQMWTKQVSLHLSLYQNLSKRIGERYSRLSHTCILFSIGVYSDWMAQVELLLLWRMSSGWKVFCWDLKRAEYHILAINNLNALHGDIFCVECMLWWLWNGKEIQDRRTCLFQNSCWVYSVVWLYYICSNVCTSLLSQHSTFCCFQKLGYWTLLIKFAK